ncbi:MAG: RNA polymerase subunit sigma-24, partial [Pyrinomonadaceae bacterium]|nr:RNA polymerase subunit sigma-24 [Pyrinomonadaceae bacterium]
MDATETEKAQTSDYALTQRTAAGEMGAFEELYARHNRRVY